VPVGDVGQAAEKAGLSTLVDMRLLELAATRLASRPEVRIVLGVSPSTLRDGEWLHGLAAHLGARTGIQTRLIVAVHEATLCETGARGRLDAMKALGVGIMLAGFGSGHASVRELRSLPADILRIDAAIVQTLTRSLDDRLFVRGLVDLAQHCGIPTLAEAVEEDASASLLAQWGADYLERPLPGGAAPAEQPVRRPRSQAA
jgi:EAL domain-containing protein (putative c-di-GMP-specific phosphodiesterase class I)